MFSLSLVAIMSIGSMNATFFSRVLATKCTSFMPKIVDLNDTTSFFLLSFSFFAPVPNYSQRIKAPDIDGLVGISFSFPQCDRATR